MRVPAQSTCQNCNGSGQLDIWLEIQELRCGQHREPHHARHQPPRGQSGDAPPPGSGTTVEKAEHAAIDLEYFFLEEGYSKYIDYSLDFLKSMWHRREKRQRLSWEQVCSVSRRIGQRSGNRNRVAGHARLLGPACLLNETSFSGIAANNTYVGGHRHDIT